jgi:hypothetical protein
LFLFFAEMATTVRVTPTGRPQLTDMAGGACAKPGNLALHVHA